MNVSLSSVASRVLGWGPWSSRFLGPPKAAVWDVGPSGRAGIIRVTEVEARPPNLPETPPRCPEPLERRLKATLINDLKPLTVIELKEGRYLAASFAVVDRSDRMLHDFTQAWQPRFRNSNSVFSACRLPRETRLTGRSLLLDVPSHGSNYFHWLVEAGGRLAAVEAAGYPVKAFDHILLNGAVRGFQRECLMVLNADPNRIFPMTPAAHLRCEVLVTASNAREHLYDLTRTRLRDWFPGRAGAASPRLLYISRADAKVRRIENEDEVMARLQRLGFVTAQLAGRTIREQADLFSGAAVVVSPHGAALANLVFCQPGTELVELHSPTYAKGLYWRMADRLRLGYTALSCGRGSANGPNPSDANLVCEVDALETEVNAALVRAGIRLRSGV